MFQNTTTLGHGDISIATVLQRQPTTADALRAKAEHQARPQRLAAERALDAALADSFPASDPPSWTLGVTYLPSETDATREIDATPDLAERSGREHGGP